MKIVHIAPNAPYNDYWGYQDNLLPKYHKKMGHEVTMITTNTMHQNGKIVKTECSDYMLSDGVRVIRLAHKQYASRILTGIAARLEVYPYLCQIKPDFVFFHGLSSTTIFDVIRYKKRINPECVIVQDSHLDYYNNQSGSGLKSKVIRAYYRKIHRKAQPYVAKVYGVTPWRKTYAQDYFAVPEEKTDVLIMGADDELIDYDNQKQVRQTVREQYGIGDSVFLVVTGGKIDEGKHIDVLIKACSDISNVKLLIFGQPKASIQKSFAELVEANPNVIYIGWIDADKVYRYFMAADLVCFPGTHSVLWEQACACKVPCLFKKWDGMDHVNNGGNSSFISQVSVESLRQNICCLRFTNTYYQMKQVAESVATDVYLYSEIARKSLECAQEL